MRKTGIMIFVIIMIIGYLFYQEIEQREAFENVEIEIDRIDVKTIDLNWAYIDIWLKVYNPSSSITATLDRVDYQMSGNGNVFGYGQIYGRTSILPGETRRIKTEYALPYSKGGAIWPELERGNVRWYYTGEAYFVLPGWRTFSVHFQDR